MDQPQRVWERFTHTKVRSRRYCESKIDGLKKHYGFADLKHYQYFSVHIEADSEHSAAEQRLLGGYVGTQNFESVRASVNRVLDALWEMLSGVVRRHAIAC